MPPFVGTPDNSGGVGRYHVSQTEHEGLAGLTMLGSIGQMRALAPLPPDSQRIIDTAVTRVGRDRLVIVEDLLAEGLSRPLPNWLSVMEIGYDSLTESGFAIRSMDLDVRGERQVPGRTRAVIPIFATIDDFSFGARELAAAERVGQPFDTAMIEQATRNCNAAIEDQAINGAGFTVNGNGAPGLLTAPANSFVYTGTNKAWDHAAKTGAEIINDVLGMMAMARADKFYGPYNLYIPADYSNALNKNYGDGVTTFDYTVRERIERIQAGGRGIRIREADMIGADETILIQPTSDVVDVIVGQTPATVSWLNGNRYRRFWMVVACMITRIRNTGGYVVGDVS